MFHVVSNYLSLCLPLKSGHPFVPLVSSDLVPSDSNLYTVTKKTVYWCPSCVVMLLIVDICCLNGSHLFSIHPKSVVCRAAWERQQLSACKSRDCWSLPQKQSSKSGVNAEVELVKLACYSKSYNIEQWQPPAQTLVRSSTFRSVPQRHGS